MPTVAPPAPQPVMTLENEVKRMHAARQAESAQALSTDAAPSESKTTETSGSAAAQTGQGAEATPSPTAKGRDSLEKSEGGEKEGPACTGSSAEGVREQEQGMASSVAVLEPPGNLGTTHSQQLVSSLPGACGPASNQPSQVHFD